MSTVRGQRGRAVKRRHSSRLYSPLKNDAATKEEKEEKAVMDANCNRLQEILGQLPAPCPDLRVLKPVGEGTFSTVFLVEEKTNTYNTYAIKHLVPTSSPDRILMEVDCLRRADGQNNVLPLSFVYRHLGDVLLAMPFIECSKFSEVVRTMDHVEVRVYMRSLLRALAHIHKLGIIHRDIKPANFLYDRTCGRFGLVDFGLAQRIGDADSGNKVETPVPKVACKRKLTSSDLADSMESPPPSSKCQTSKKRRPSAPFNSGSPPRRVLVNRTAEEINVLPVNERTRRTPVKSADQKPDLAYYDRRGAILCARKRTRASTRNSQPLSDDVFADLDESNAEVVTSAVKKTPSKRAVPVTEEVRRSPRKHPGSKTPGFSKLTISASAIVSDAKNNPLSMSSNSTASGFRRRHSFTILDPASGIPSDGTPRLQASLTSRHSTMTTTAATPLIMPPNSVHVTIANMHGGQQTHQQHPSLTVNNSSHHSNVPNARESSFANRFATPVPKRKDCGCFGTARVCTRCLAKRSQRAARAGTPGFRPPEVLLRVEHQTTSVDMWAAGVILLCILSRTYPFFRAPDDMTALGELMTIFGTKAVQEASCQYGKRLVTSENIEPLDLQVFCQRLAQRRPPEEIERSYETSSSLCLASDQAVDLLSKLMTLSAHDRLTAEEALKHPFFED